MDGGPAPAEWRMIKAIRNYGLANVIGDRLLSAQEIKRMDYIEREQAKHAEKVRAVINGK